MIASGVPGGANQGQAMAYAIVALEHDKALGWDIAYAVADVPVGLEWVQSLESGELLALN